MIAGLLLAEHVHLDVELVELVWLLLAAVGLTLAVDAYVYAREDCDLLDEYVPPADERRDVTRELELERALVAADLAGARWLIVFELLILAAGVVSAFHPPPSSGRTPVGWLLIALLLFASAAIPARLYGQRRRRRSLLEPGRHVRR